MTETEAVEQFVAALIAPLRDVGTLLAQAIDDLSARVTQLERRLDEASVGNPRD